MSDPSKIPASVIPIFDGSNYKQWSTIITGICRHNNSWSVVKPGGNRTPTTDPAEKAAWEEKNDKALGLFTIYMHPTLHRFLTKEDGSDRTAGEVWDELKKSYGKANAITGFVDFQTLTRTVFTTETPLRSQITSMEASRARCIEAGIQVTESMFCLMMLTALPASWSTFTSSFLTGKKVADLTSTVVSVVIYQEESLRVAQRSNDGVNRISSTTSKPRRCTHCGGTNHIVDNCWDLHGKPQNSNNKGKGNQNNSGQGGGNRKKKKGGGGGGNNNNNGGNNSGQSGSGSGSNNRSVNTSSSSTQSISVSVLRVG
ncbi:hypothetical protein JAAARDRAFT_190049 [Jaapia argillacea MUCL 33604]|uniref:DUF4219 domain-containing protein n=1 Tax=Jaapia argillacea MUCL 33604 TaxID=933084 RepID=A0A067Q704_9AGAM|nr:hypothetical protein JAAARDRAFT_190049 [Jaapia argillacea MUCL 33604]